MCASQLISLVYLAVGIFLLVLVSPKQEDEQDPVGREERQREQEESCELRKQPRRNAYTHNTHLTYLKLIHGCTIHLGIHLLSLQTRHCLVVVLVWWCGRVYFIEIVSYISSSPSSLLHIPAMAKPRLAYLVNRVS